MAEDRRSRGPRVGTRVRPRSAVSTRRGCRGRVHSRRRVIPARENRPKQPSVIRRRYEWWSWMHVPNWVVSKHYRYFCCNSDIFFLATFTEIFVIFKVIIPRANRLTSHFVRRQYVIQVARIISGVLDWSHGVVVFRGDSEPPGVRVAGRRAALGSG